jgi:hypothetical protein
MGRPEPGRQPTDRELAYALDQALEQTDTSGPIYRDRAAMAVYRLEPTWLTLIGCRSCGFASFVPSIPRSAIFTHNCGSCGAAILLMPPPEVLAVHTA